jgi:hypothetical protein
VKSYDLSSAEAFFFKSGILAGQTTMINRGGGHIETYQRNISVEIVEEISAGSDKIVKVRKRIYFDEIIGYQKVPVTFKNEGLS